MRTKLFGSYGWPFLKSKQELFEIRISMVSRPFCHFEISKIHTVRTTSNSQVKFSYFWDGWNQGFKLMYHTNVLYGFECPRNARHHEFHAKTGAKKAQIAFFSFFNVVPVSLLFDNVMLITQTCFSYQMKIDKITNRLVPSFRHYF